MTAPERLVTDATCLGCGCTCDDIDVRLDGDRIVEARNACPMGVSWFGDGRIARRALRQGKPCSEADALEAIAQHLVHAQSPLVYLAPNITCEAQREGVALADLLRATLDSVTSDTTLPSVLASQQRGRATATLGEVRNRADVLVFWGVDPATRYPRFAGRYAPDPVGVHLAQGRRSRTVIAVDIGDARGPADADLRLDVPPGEEVAALLSLAAALETSAVPSHQAADDSALQAAARAAVVDRIRNGRYTVVVADAEPPSSSPADTQRAEALVMLSFALNGAGRGALSLLRAGGNRAGADAVMTWQTGFPAAVAFTRGYPQYQPRSGTATSSLGRGAIDAVLVLGDVALVPEALLSTIGTVTTCVIGPRASDSPLSRGAVVLDTGVAGIHESGTVLRMDDVPLPVRAIFSGGNVAEVITRALRERIVALQRDERVEHSRASNGGAANTARREELFQRRTDG